VPLRDVPADARPCRCLHGGTESALRLVEARGLKWYRVVAIARRGFCSECGGSIFWEPAAKDYVAIAAGTLDAPTGLRRRCRFTSRAPATTTRSTSGSSAVALSVPSYYGSGAQLSWAFYSLSA
jgi:hypothetical protein